MSKRDKCVEETLVAVRSAYRLLFQYQDSMKSTIYHIADQLGLEPVGGQPLFSNAPSRSGNLRDKWAWDWLGLYCFRFDFTIPNSSIPNEQLSVILQSDTGFYQRGEGVKKPGNEPQEQTEPISDHLDFSQWEVKEKSESRLIFWRRSDLDGQEDILRNPNPEEHNCLVVPISAVADENAVQSVIQELKSKLNITPTLDTLQHQTLEDEEQK